MFKLLFIIALLVVGAFTYLKNKGYDIQAVKDGSILKTPTPIPTATPTPAPTPKNRIAVGTCFFIPASDVEFFKVEGFDANTNLYSYRLCHKYKGCLKELSQDDFNHFEKDFKAEKILPCP